MWICSHWWPDCSRSSQFHVFSLGWWVGLFVFILLWGLLTLEAIASWSLSSKTRPYINSDSWLTTRAHYWASKEGGGYLPGLCRLVAAPGLSVHRAPGLISSYLRLRGDQSQPTASLEFVIPVAYAFFLLLFLKLFKSRLLRVPGQPQLTYYSQVWWWTPDSLALGSPEGPGGRSAPGVCCTTASEASSVQNMEIPISSKSSVHFKKLLITFVIILFICLLSFLETGSHSNLI